MQNEVQIMEARKSGNIIVTLKNDKQSIIEFDQGKEVKRHLLDGQKTLIR